MKYAADDAIASLEIYFKILTAEHAPAQIMAPLKAQSFLAEVLSWSLADVQDKKLFKYELMDLPPLYDSPAAWARAFHYHILEEARFQLETEIFVKNEDKFNFAVTYHFPKECPGLHKNRVPGVSVFQLCIDVPAGPTPLPGTLGLFLKTDLGRKDLKDIVTSLDEATTLAFFGKIMFSRPEETGETGKKTNGEKEPSDVKPSDVIVVGGHSVNAFLHSQELRTQSESAKANAASTGTWLVFLLSGLVPSERICDALSAQEFPRNGLMQELISCTPSRLAPTDFALSFGDFDSRDRLNLSQVEVLANVQHRLRVKDEDRIMVEDDVLSYTNCPRIQIVHGPPGTGKTATLAALLVELMRDEKNTVWAAAPTNQAICELASRTKREADGQIGAIPLDQIVLVGNKDRIGSQLHPDVSAVYIGSRFQRVKGAMAIFFSPLHGDILEMPAAIELFIKDNVRLVDCEAWKTALCDTVVSFLSPGVLSFDLTEAFSRKKNLPNSASSPWLWGKLLVKWLVHRVNILMDQGHILIQEAPNNYFYKKKRLALKTQLTELRKTPPLLESVVERWCTTPSYVDEGYDHELIGLFQNLRTSLHSFVADMKSTTQDCISVKEKGFLSHVLTHARLFFSTVSAAGSTMMIAAKQMCNVVMIDEATQLCEAATAIMLSASVEILILAGDHKQLPALVAPLLLLLSPSLFLRLSSYSYPLFPFFRYINLLYTCLTIQVLSDTAAKKGYGKSLFERLLDQQYPATLLNVQYRMHPQISLWPNTQFYEGKINDSPLVKTPLYTRFWHGSIPPLSVYEIAGREEKSLTGSWFNTMEIAVATKLVRELYTLFKDSDPLPGLRLKVGIITPYSAQQKLLEDKFGPHGSMQFLKTINGDSLVGIDVTVKTVDGFQGQECDLIFFLAVRCNSHGEIGFLKDERRLNVALTRAKFSLVVIGHTATLRSNPIWNSFLTHASDTSGTVKNSQSSYILAEVEKEAKQNAKRMALLLGPEAKVFESLEWGGKILFMQKFKNSFPRLQSDKLRGDIMGKLVSLAGGKWPYAAATYEIKPYNPSEVLEGIFYKTVFGQHAVLWTVDLQVFSVFVCVPACVVVFFFHSFFLLWGVFVYVYVTTNYIVPSWFLL